MRALPSEPERFVLEVLAGGSEASRVCTFTLPGGRWERGRWDVVGRVPSATPFLCKRIGEDTLCQVDGEADRERYHVSGAVGSGNLAQIHATWGGSFAVEMTDLFAEAQPEGAVDAVVSCTLTAHRSGVRRGVGSDGGAVYLYLRCGTISGSQTPQSAH